MPATRTMLFALASPGSSEAGEQVLRRKPRACRSMLGGRRMSAMPSAEKRRNGRSAAHRRGAHCAIDEYTIADVESRSRPFPEQALL